MTSTTRLYEAAWASFLRWCSEHVGTNPPSDPDIARYLEHVEITRGPSSVPVHLSAIAAMYREQGRPLDVKQPAFQEALQNARALKRQHAATRRTDASTIEAAITRELRRWDGIASQADLQAAAPEMARAIRIAISRIRSSHG